MGILERQGWTALQIQDNTINFTTQGDITFTCPLDLEPTQVGGQKQYWIRTRIISGDYGRKFCINGDGHVVPGHINPPQIQNFTINYTQAESLEHCLTLNNLEFRDRIEESKSGKRFKPFIAMDVKHQALYLGFDKPPLKGPISLFFSLEEQEYSEADLPRIEWEYYRKQNGIGEWIRLEVVDQTTGLTQSGCIEFIGPPDFTEATFFGKKCFWIRALDVQDKFKPVQKSLTNFIDREPASNHKQENSLVSWIDT